MSTKKLYEIETLDPEELSPKKRRERSENWTEQEKAALISLIKIYGKSVLDKSAEKKEKDLAWAQIYHGMRIQGCRREKTKLKDMWKRMKMLAKANNYHKKMTSLDIQVANLVPEILAVDSNANQKYLLNNINQDSLPLTNHHEHDIMEDDGSQSPVSIIEEKHNPIKPLDEVIIQNSVPFEHLRVTPDLIEEKSSYDVHDDRIRQQIKHEDALFKLKYEHIQKMYELEIEQKQQKHKLEMEILLDVKEKLKSSNVNFLDVINHFK